MIDAELLDREVLAEAQRLSLVIDEHELLAERGNSRAVFAELLGHRHFVAVEERTPGLLAHAAVDRDGGLLDAHFRSFLIVSGLKASDRLLRRRRVVVDRPRIAGEPELAERARHPGQDLFVVRDFVAGLAQVLEASAIAGEDRQGALRAFLAEVLVRVLRAGRVRVPRDEHFLARPFLVEA